MGKLIILILQHCADIWKHFGCLCELVQIDKQNALKFTPSHFTSPGDSSHSEADLAGETQLSDGEPLAVQTYGLAVTSVMNISALSEAGWHILSRNEAAQTDAAPHTHTNAHTRSGFSMSSASALNLASQMSPPGLSQWARTSYRRKHTSEQYLWSHFEPWPFRILLAGNDCARGSRNACLSSSRSVWSKASSLAEWWEVDSLTVCEK